MSFPKKPTRRRLWALAGQEIKRNIYLDNAAATPLDFRVLKTMHPYLNKDFYNPSALYSKSVNVRKAVENSRKKIANILSAQSDSIIFTSSGTESTNLAILGAARKNKAKGKHIITTEIEHHAVFNPIKQLEKEGYEVTYLKISPKGDIDLGELKKALRPDTVLISIMYANNEIGSVLPIADIGREILKWRKQNNSIYPYFHTDACQAAGYLDLNVEKLHVDLMSLNGSKIYGPKGVGVLFKKRGINIDSIMYGGGQEFGLRPGTENTASIVGMSKALELIQNKNKNIEKLRDYFWEKIKKEIKGVKLNGPEIGEKRLPNNLNIMFENVEAENLIIYLNSYGIMCSSGSACTTDSDELSHVLLACGLSEEEARSSIRFTLGYHITKKDIDYVTNYLSNIVSELRRVRDLV